MLELEEAQQRILDATKVLSNESVLLAEADGRILAEKIISPIDLPRFDNSAVDGYAIRADDLKSATRAHPIALQLRGKIVAGESSSTQLESGGCIRIFTGSPLPPGADAVAMQEDTQADSRTPNEIQFLDSVKAWENIRFKGEDVKTGSILAGAGEKLNAGHLSLFAAVGIKNLRVGKSPVIGILSTGSELCESDEALQPGQIFESNRIAIAALARKIGAVPKIFPLVPDTLAATKHALEKAFSECDAVVTTGGVSVGELDFVKAAFTELGGNLDFWKVSMKPGKPFVMGRLGEKLLFGLPGNPVSALVTFLLLVAPALSKMQGANFFAWPNHPGILAEPLENRGERRHFIRVFADAKGNVRSAGTQASHILSSLAKANGLVEVPPETTLAIGANVSVLRWEF